MSTHEIQRQITEAEKNLRRLKDRLWQEQLPQRQEGQEPPDPEQVIQDYPWPSSRITKADMIRLTELRRILRKPITKILSAAVTAYYKLLTNKRHLKIVSYHGEGRSLWYVVDAEAANDEQPCVVATAPSMETAEAILRSLSLADTPGHP
jgi:hypothetical protein